jgi:hypothetical protein
MRSPLSAAAHRLKSNFELLPKWKKSSGTSRARMDKNS